MTYALKPYPAYKDSGVHWLGKIPSHWDTLPIRRYCRVFAGATPSRAVPEYWNGGSIPWLASGDVNLRRITRASQFITEAGFAASSTKWIEPGSLVVALAGQGRTKGMVATVEFRTTCNQSLGVLVPSAQKCDYRFLAYYLESRYLDIRGLVGDDIRDGLNLDHLKSIPTPLPPREEQTVIVRFLDHVDSRVRRYVGSKRIVNWTKTSTMALDLSIGYANRQIDLFCEYRARMIADMVTGELDVRTTKVPETVDTEDTVPQYGEVDEMIEEQGMAVEEGLDANE